MAAVETLTTVWDANYDKFERKLNAVLRMSAATADKVEKAWGGVNDNLDRSFDKAGKGLGSFANSARGAAAGAATATAAIALLAGAMQGARSAAAFSADLKDTAAAVHIGTDALQEYQYALSKVGGDGEKAADALGAFSEKLGKAQGGVRSAVQAFRAVGISKAQLDSFKSTEEALDAVISRVGELRNTAQQDAAISTLGLDQLAPLIREGTAEMARLRDEAHKAGVVMDADLIKRGAEIDDQFKTISRVIDIQLKSALVDLGPVLVTLLGYLASFAKEAAQIADSFRSIQNKSLAGLEDRRSDLSREAVRLGTKQLGGKKLSAPEQQVLDRANAQIAQIDAELASRKAALGPVPPGGNRNLVAPPSRTRTTRTPRDTTEERTEQVNAVVASASRDLLRAMLDLTANTEDRAAIEKQIAEEEARVQAARIAKLSADIADDKGLKTADKARLQLQLEAARIEADRVASLKAAAIDQEAANKTARQQLDLQIQGLDAEAEILRIQASVARSAEQRRTAELALLDLADRRAEAELQAIIATQGVADAERALAQKKLDDLKASRSLREGEVRQGTMGPFESFVAEYADAGANIERMEAAGVRAFQNLSDGLADAIVNAESLGDVARNVFNQLISDLLSQSINQAGAQLLPSLFKVGAAVLGIPAYANGTNAHPGGLAWVGERGKELVNLPKGAEVIPNHKLRTSDLRSGVVAVTIVQPVSLDLRHAVTTTELIESVNAQMEASRKLAVAQATALASKAAPSRLQQYNALGS